MVKKLFTLLLTSVLAFPLSTIAFAPEAAAQDKAAKEARWEGDVIRSSADKSTLTVRKVGSSAGEDCCSMIARRNGSVRSTAAKRSTILMPARSKIMIG